MEKMKNISKLAVLFFIFTALLGCRTTGAGTYRMTFDPSIDDEYVQGAWMSYTVPIRNDMFQYYKKNPKGDYITPFNVEITARNNLINFYSNVQKEYDIDIYDTYIEDLIKIRDSGNLNEYVFFSFNPGNWTNNKDFDKDSYTQWMNNNMPFHIPLTLAHVEKIK